MGSKARLGAVVAAVAVIGGSVMLGATPALAATTCTTSPISGNWMGTGGGWWFYCHGTTPATVRIQIYCANAVAPNGIYNTEDHREIGAPWSFSSALTCGNAQFADSPSWRTI